MKLSAITIGPRSRRTLTGIDSLAASIEKVGLIHPPAVREVDGQFVLVAGHRRIEAMRSLGWTTTSPPRSRPPSPHVGPVPGRGSRGRSHTPQSETPPGGSRTGIRKAKQTEGA